MKKLMMTMALLPMMVLADTWRDPNTGITWTYVINGGNAQVGESYYSSAISRSTTGAITIPSFLGGCPVTSIGDYAFYECTELTSITIPSSVNSLGEYAFTKCRKLTTIAIPSGVTSIPNCAFKKCSGLKSVSIPLGVTIIGWEAFKECTSLSSVIIPSTMVKIEEYAFKNCTSLTSVTIPASVTYLEGSEDYGSGMYGGYFYVFEGCDALREIKVALDNPVFSSQDGILYNKDGSVLICCPPGRNGEVIVSRSVTVVDEGAFDGCHGLAAVTIPDRKSVV